MKGLIASVLGGVSKGVGQVAQGQIELNARQALMEAEEEMRARLAEAAEARAETRQIAAEGREDARQIEAEQRAQGSPVELQRLELLREQTKGVKQDSEWAEKQRDIRQRLMEASTPEEEEELFGQLDAMLTTGTRAQRAQDNVAAGARYVDIAELYYGQADDLRRAIRDGEIYEATDIEEATRKAEGYEEKAERAVEQGSALISGGGRPTRGTGRPSPGLLRNGFKPQNTPANRPPLESFLQ